MTQKGLEKKKKEAQTQNKGYLMAIEKGDATKENVEEKLQAYQNLKEQYLIQKQELKNENI